MKKLSCFVLLSLILIPSLVSAAGLTRLTADSRITSVTVYPDRALVSRVASFSFKPGVYLVAFENLPALLQDDSVQVKGSGSAGAIVSGIEIKRVFLDHSGDGRVQELDKQIHDLELRSGSLDSKKSGFVAQKAFIESIRVAWSERISRELAVGRPTSAELSDATSFIGLQVTKTEEQSREVDAEKKNIADKIESLRRKRNEIAGSGKKESKNVEALVEITREGSLVLELAAVTLRAGWTPVYDARLTANAAMVDFVFRAMVRQQTGEDWTNVKLTLSTARPAAGGAPPELKPWHISLYQPSPSMGRSSGFRAVAAESMMSSDMMMANKTASSRDAMAAEEAAVFETSSVASEQTSVVFNVPRQLDIPSDNSGHFVVVAMERFPVSTEYVAAPKLSPYVFLNAEVTNQASYPLLPGKVSAFVGSTFTGASYLKKIAAGEKFDLFFGADEQVTVTREEEKQRGEAGIFGSNKINYRYRIALENFRKTPVTVKLLDQLPLAGNEEIGVSLANPSQKPDEMKSDGSMMWNISLKAGEKRNLDFGILVEYPKGRELRGL